MQKVNRKASENGMLSLHDLMNYGKILGVSELEFSDNMSMREFKSELEKHILEEVHPYKIYESGRAKDQWITYLPDETKKDKRRQIKRNGYDNICKAVIEFYLEQYHLDMLLDELFEDWARYRRDESPAKAGTVRKDVSLWRTHCREVKVDKIPLGCYKVNEVTPKLLYRFFRGLTKDREYTRQTIRNIRGVLNGMFNYAVEGEIIETNPVRDVDLKQMTYKPTMSKSDDVYSYDEAQTLLSVLRDVDDDPYALAIRLDFNMFIRVGEIAGLKWENVDIENRSIFICHQITYEPEMNDDLTFTEKKMVTEGYLKGCTSQGYRSEYLTDEAIDVLEKAKRLNPDSEFVFYPFGRPILTTTFNKRLKKYCEKAGIPYRSSHKIRFYAASAAYDGKNLPQISKMMGHSQISTTMHYLRDVEKDNDYEQIFRNLGSQGARENPA